MLAAAQEKIGRHLVTQSSTMRLPAREQVSGSIDHVHLERVALGDRSLEREVWRFSSVRRR
jgi:hypothetical protein